MTALMLGLVGLVSAAVAISGNEAAAIVWPFAVLVFWVLQETLTITLFLHRNLTHGSWRTRSHRLTAWCLWWTRSGAVKFWEWVENHAWHHLNTDTDRDSYTPQKKSRLTFMPPLRPPRPWRFLDNARSYHRFSVYTREHPEVLEELGESREGAAALARLAELESARRAGSRIGWAQTVNWLAFAISMVPLALVAGGWWVPLVVVVGAWLMLGLKVYLYLMGGYIINYYGHQAKGRLHQSDIPAWLMLLTLFVMGEGWHRFHHDAPFAAQFHPWLDPGWWALRTAMAMGWAGDVWMAEQLGERLYRPRRWQAA